MSAEIVNLSRGFSPLNYIYSLRNTDGATGFAACVPDPAPGLHETLQILAGRPLDTFLHRHALELLLKESPKQWRDLAFSCLRERKAHIAALLLELARLRPEAGVHMAASAGALAEAARPFENNTPEILLIRPEVNKSLRQSWHDNIHQHKLLPDTGEETEELRREKERLARTQGLLKRQQESFSESQIPADPLPGDPASFLAEIYKTLEKCGAKPGQEMRHEASLSPIALLRSWQLQAGVACGRNVHTLRGQATAYGRGLKLVQARISCNMEILERLCAHVQADDAGAFGSIDGKQLRYSSWKTLAGCGQASVEPMSLGAPEAANSFPLHWITGEDSSGKELLVPAQAAYLFCNLDEVSLFEHTGSTGLACGATMEGARLHALTEVLERYAHATTPFRKETCFELSSRNPVIQGLLDDYSWRGIRVQFQDITTEFGLPSYRCFVQGKNGGIAQSTGANLNGAKAALAALTETPWPYAWANPAPAPSGRGLEDLPKRALEDLPGYGFNNAKADLALLEKVLYAADFNPIYVNLGKADIPFPACRVLVPGLTIDTELDSGPSATLLARSKYFPKGHDNA